MADNNSALIIPEEHQANWNYIVSTLLEDLEETDLPDKVLRATELLINGYPLYKVAKEIRVSKDTVRDWLTKYPAMTAAIAHSKKLLVSYRMSMMEQQFVKAVEKSQEIMELELRNALVDPEGNESPWTYNTKLAGIQAQHARFIISLFMGQKQDIQIGLNEETRELLQGNRDALDYIAGQLAKQRDDEEVIEVSYRVVDEANPTGPLLDGDGNPHYGSLGELDTNDAGTQCHICGERFKQLAIHIRTGEKMSIEAYESAFLLDRGSVNSAVQ